MWHWNVPSTCKSHACAARSRKIPSCRSIFRRSEAWVTCWSPTVAEGFSLKRFLPRGLFGRSLIIIVAPIVLLQAIIAYVFFERDLDTTTRRLARDVAADMAVLVALEDNSQGADRVRLRALAARQFNYRIRFLPGQNLPAHHGPLTSNIDIALDDILEQRIGPDRDFIA